MPTVPAGDALPVGNDGRADASDVLWPPAGFVPVSAARASRRHHQRNGHPELFQSRPVRQDVRPRCHDVNENCFINYSNLVDSLGRVVGTDR